MALDDGDGNWNSDSFTFKIYISNKTCVTQALNKFGVA